MMGSSKAIIVLVTLHILKLLEIFSLAKGI